MTAVAERLLDGRSKVLHCALEYPRYTLRLYLPKVLAYLRQSKLYKHVTTPLGSAPR